MNLLLKIRIIEKFGFQADFAQAVGEHPSFVSMVVRGRREIDPVRRTKWAKALNRKEEELFEIGGK